MNKLQKFITSVAIYITKAKQTIIATPVHSVAVLVVQFIGLCGSCRIRENERVVRVEEEHRGAIGVREGEPAKP